MYPPFRRNGSLIAVLAAALLAAACSSTTSATSTTSTPATTGASPVAPASSASAVGSAASGTPITIFGMAPVHSQAGSAPGVAAALKAAARGVNARGGINGHPLQVTFCNSQGDPNQEVACAHQAVSSGAAAVISGIFFANPGGVLSILQAGHVASLAGTATASQDMQNPVSFPLDAGELTPEVCDQLVKVGAAKKLGTVASSFASIEQDAAVAAAAAKAGHVPFAGGVTLPPNAPDVTSEVQHVAGLGASGVMLFTLPNQAVQVIQAAASLGKSMSFCSLDGILFASQLQQLGAAAGDVYVAATMPPLSAASTNPAVAHFVSDMKAEQGAGDPDASLSLAAYSSTALRAWAGVQAFAQVAATISGPVTAASFLAALSKATNVTTGVYPPVDFARPVGGTAYPRLFNPYLMLLKWNPATSQLITTGVTRFKVAEATG